MFESQYNDEMALEVQRLEAKNRAIAVGHPEWANACSACGCELKLPGISKCERCLTGAETIVSEAASSQ